MPESHTKKTVNRTPKTIVSRWYGRSKAMKTYKVSELRAKLMKTDSGEETKALIKGFLKQLDN